MYIGKDYSEGAFLALANGEKPYEDWGLNELVNLVKTTWKLNASRFPREVLRKCFLYKSSSHHVGKNFKKVEFYSFDNTLDKETAWTIMNLQMEAFRKNTKTTPVWKYGYIIYTAKNAHGHISRNREYGKSDGTTFISNEGKKRLLSWKRIHSFTEVFHHEEAIGHSYVKGVETFPIQYNYYCM